jgi:hypothetical protein
MHSDGKSEDGVATSGRAGESSSFVREAIQLLINLMGVIW